MSIIRRDGFDFGFDPETCETCPGHCCCGESGTIWVNQPEIFQISNFLKINPIDFIRQYLNLIDNRFSIKERLGEHGLECVFFDSAQRRCSIYNVRPLQCREFPFWEHFKKHKTHVAKECPGIIARGVAEKNSLISNDNAGDAGKALCGKIIKKIINDICDWLSWLAPAAGFKPVRQTVQGLLFGSIPKPVFILQIESIERIV